MKTFTPSSASRLVRKLADEKGDLQSRESERQTYVVASGEEPEIPTYDYEATRRRIAEIDLVTRKLRHALHAHNAVTEAGGLGITIDEALIELAQLSSERRLLDDMRRREQRVRRDRHTRRRERMDLIGYADEPATTPEAVEYLVCNYDVEQAERDYQATYERIIELQGAIDYANEVTTFEVDV